MTRVCRNCGRPLPAGDTAKRRYCSEKCRREYQNKLRKEERQEETDLCDDAAQAAWLDPWQRNDLEAGEEIYANALLDPLPDDPVPRFFFGVGFSQKGAFAMRIEQNAAFLSQLKRHEGLRLSTYRCTAGALTIGYGHNLDANPIPDINANTKITEDRAGRILAEDCRKLAETLDKRLPWWRELNPPRQAVILNMAFNLGIAGLLGFKNTIAAMEEGRFADAANGMLASKWAKQVKRRAAELAKQMRSGEWDN